MPISNFMKIHPVGAQLFHVDRRTDGQTDMMKLIVAFCNHGINLISNMRPKFNVETSGIYSYHCASQGVAVAQWLRYCATNRKVAGSIPAGVIGIFQ